MIAAQLSQLLFRLLFGKALKVSRLAIRYYAVCALVVLLNAQNSSSGQDSIIRKVIEQYLSARERADPKALAELLTPDVDQLVSSGEWRKGREAVVRGALASSASTGGHRSIEIQTVRFLAPGLALADGTYRLTGLAGGNERKMWSAFLLKRDSATWRIAAIRNMLPAAPVPRKQQ